MARGRREPVGYYLPLLIAVAMLAGVLGFLVELLHAGALLLWDATVH